MVSGSIFPDSMVLDSMVSESVVPESMVPGSVVPDSMGLSLSQTNSLDVRASGKGCN